MLIHIGVSDASSLPVMKNNIYIQKADGELGRYGTNPTKHVMFGKDIKKYVMDNLKEQAGS